MLHRLLTVSYILLMCSAVEATTLSGLLRSSGSHASLTLELSFETLEALVKQAIEPKYMGERDDPTDALKDDKLTWEASPMITGLSEKDGGIIANGFAQGRARISGKLIFANISASTALKADAHVIVNPEINSDWTISLNANGNAMLTVADIEGASVRSLLQPSLDAAFAEALSDLNNRFSDAQFLRNHVLGFWKESCKTKAAAGKLRIMPNAIAVTQPEVTDTGLRVTVVISGQVLPATTPPACSALPEEINLLK